MKRVTLCILAALVLAAIPIAAQDSTGGLRYSITVTKFENQAGWYGQWDIGDAWGTVMTDMLNQTGRFIVLGESDMRAAALDEQDFAASGRTAGGAKAPATGQMTPAQLLVKGAITHVQDDTAGGGGGVRIKGFNVGGGGGKGEINATIYVVDSTTGQVLASTNVVGTSKKKALNLGYSTGDWGAAFGGHKNDNVGKAVESAVAEAVQFLLDQLPNVPWTGSVVMTKDGKVYVNRGSREGVTVGRQFAVGDVEVLRDPDTGEVLDESMTEIATLQVSEVKEKLSICTVTSGDAGAVAKGMAIHLR
ncbi:MAG: CsgG/HfaB family protein [Thermoanaerobaculales bacterium]|jgi:curli biogenesis system outer membrane secretion channel CsgG|nr:CsgG/HfaB family protein [Thermoanaerobaculales bacterium]